MRRHSWIPGLLALVLSFGLSAPAVAQSRTESPKLFVTAGVMAQLTRNTFNDSVTTTIYSEDGQIQQAFKAKRGIRFEFGGGFRLNEKFIIGGLVSLMSVDGPLDVTASVPHPFFFNQPRTGTASSTAKRTVRDIEAQIMYVLVDSPDWQISVGGGPSFAHVTQDVGTGLDITDVYPYDTVTVNGVTMTKTSGSRIGVNVGGSVTKVLTARFGVTGNVRWTGASIELNADTPSGKLKIQTGGVQVGGSVRVMF